MGKGRVNWWGDIVLVLFLFFFFLSQKNCAIACPKTHHIRLGFVWRVNGRIEWKQGKPNHIFRHFGKWLRSSECWWLVWMLARAEQHACIVALHCYLLVSDFLCLSVGSPLYYRTSIDKRKRKELSMNTCKSLSTDFENQNQCLQCRL